MSRRTGRGLVIVCLLLCAACGGEQDGKQSDILATLPDGGLVIADSSEPNGEIPTTDVHDTFRPEDLRNVDFPAEITRPGDLTPEDVSDAPLTDLLVDQLESDTTSLPDQIAPTDQLDTHAPPTDTLDTQVTPTDTVDTQDGASKPLIERVVLAGDSWSCGLIQPLRDELDARGYDTIELNSQHTTCAGSTLAEWLQNQHPPAIGGGQDFTKPKMLDALHASLDADPPARILFVVLGGNDYNGQCGEGLGTLDLLEWLQVFTWLQETVQAYVDIALAGRPHLRVVLIGYDYFHFEFLQALGLSLEGLNTYTYNMGLVELDKRRKEVGQGTPNVIFAHNLGILQHTYGDTIHPPFTIPNPLLGFPEYGPGEAPKPGPAPGYAPFPGGWPAYPAPLVYMPDGIPPSPPGLATIISNTLDQVPVEWFQQ